jgi:adenylate cyclase
VSVGLRAQPVLGVASYLAAKGDLSTIEIRVEENLFIIGDKKIPIDGSGKVRLRFRGGPGTYETFSAAAVIQSELLLREGEEPSIDPDVFNDCYVFLGASAPELHAALTTPAGPSLTGVEIHATLLDNLLSSDFLR